MIRLDSLTIEESTCVCSDCQAMCRTRPCWGTPAEIEAIMAAGFANRLMLDYWTGEEPFDIVSPAIKGREGSDAPFLPLGQCTFLTDGGRCELHELGLKPVEGRLAHHALGREGADLHEAVAESWHGIAGEYVSDTWEGAFYQRRRHG